MIQKNISDGTNFKTFCDKDIATQLLNNKDIEGLQKYEAECVEKFVKKYNLRSNGKKNVLFLGKGNIILFL